MKSKLLALLMVMLLTVAVLASCKLPFGGDKMSVTLDVAGGTLTSGENYSVSTNAAYTLPTPVKEGFVFDGWYNGRTKVPMSGDKWTLGEVTLRAKWVKQSTITLDPAGGTVEGGNNLVITEGIAYTIPTPTRAGYAFEGWYDGDTKVALTGSSWILGDVTLTAKWKRIPNTVTLNPDGGTVAEGNTFAATEGVSYTLPTPVREGYDFGGWYNGETAVAITGDSWTLGNITLTAKWNKIAILVTLDPAGGTLSGGNTYSAYDGEPYELPGPVREGYLFAGWLYNGEEFELSGSAWTYGAITLTADWIETITLTLDTDGGTVPGGNSYVVYAGIGYELPIPVKEGYTFIGWYSGITEIALSGSVWNYGNVAITAKWAKNITVTLNPAGGTVAGGNACVVDEGRPYTLPVPTPESVVNSFDGWYNGDTLIPATGDAWTYGEGLTLTAKWITGSAVTLVPSGGTLADGNEIYCYSNAQYTLPTPVKANNYFVGWYIGDTEVPMTGAAWTLGEVTLSAKWIVGTSVSLDAGTGATVEGGNTYTAFCGVEYILPTPVKEGCFFDGWYVDGSGTRVPRTADAWTIGEEGGAVALVAIWKEQVDSMTYDFGKESESNSYIVVSGVSGTDSTAYIVDGEFVITKKDLSSATSTFVSFRVNNKSGLEAFVTNNSNGTRYVFESDFTLSGGTNSGANNATLGIGFLNGKVGDHGYSNNHIYGYGTLNPPGADTVKFFGQTLNKGETYRIRVEQVVGDDYLTAYIYINDAFAGTYTAAQTTSLSNEMTHMYGFNFAFSRYAEFSNDFKVTFDDVYVGIVKDPAVNVTLNPAGGTVDGGNVIALAQGGAYTLPTPVKSNSYFEGWLYNGELIELSGKAWTYGEISLTAKWIDGTALTLDADGGTLEGGNSYTVFAGKEYTLPTPQKSGFGFIGWYNGDTLIPISGDAWTYGEEITLVAKWVSESAVALVPGTDATVEGGNTYAAYNGVAYNLPIPVRAGYRFDGWYNGDTRVPVFGDSWSLGSVTLTAKWMKEVAGNTNNFDGGTTSGVVWGYGNGEVATNTLKDGGYVLDKGVSGPWVTFLINSNKTPVTNNTDGTRYVFETDITYLGGAPIGAAYAQSVAFAGFNNGSADTFLHGSNGNCLIADCLYSTASDADGDGYADKIEFYNQYLEKDITYRFRAEVILSEGTYSLTHIYVNDVYVGTVGSDNTGASNIATQVYGFSFTYRGQNGANNCSIKFDNVYVGVVIPEEIYVEPEMINVTLDPSGGTLSGGLDYTFLENAEYTLPTPVRDGHYFDGWYKDGTLVPLSGDAWTFGEGTLTAKWIAAITVTLDPNGGTLEGGNSYTAYTGKAYTLPIPTMEGYFFDGWYNGDTRVPALGDSWELGSVTLTAKWLEEIAGNFNDFNDGTTSGVVWGYGNGEVASSTIKDGGYVLDKGVSGPWVTFLINPDKTPVSGNTDGTRYVFETDITYLGGAPIGAAYAQSVAFAGFNNGSADTFLHGSNQNCLCADCLYSTNVDADGDNYADKIEFYNQYLEKDVTYRLRVEVVLADGTYSLTHVYVNDVYVGTVASNNTNSGNTATQVYGFSFTYRGQSGANACSIKFDNVYVGVVK